MASWPHGGDRVDAKLQRKVLNASRLALAIGGPQSSMCDTPPKDYQDGEGALQAMNKQWLNGEGEQGDTIRMAAEVYKLMENFSREGRGVDTKNINQASGVLENHTQESSTEVAISGHNRLWIERNLAIQSKGQPFSSQGTPPPTHSMSLSCLALTNRCKTFRMARMARRAQQGGRGQQVCGVSGEVACVPQVRITSLSKGRPHTIHAWCGWERAVVPLFRFVSKCLFCTPLQLKPIPGAAGEPLMCRCPI